MPIVAGALVEFDASYFVAATQWTSVRVNYFAKNQAVRLSVSGASLN